MAHSLTVKKTAGQADDTAIDPTNSGTATAVGGTEMLIGPPVYGGLKTQGRYIRSVAGTAGIFTFLRDEPITGASPTSYTYVGIAT
jgi:hypothetical protein